MSLLELLLATILPAAVTLITLFSSALLSARRDFLEMRKLNQYKLVGILGEVPEVLAQYPDYWSVSEARKGQGDIRLLHLRTLSYGLRKCKFVIADHSDGKVIDWKDEDKIRQLILDKPRRRRKSSSSKDEAIRG